jgi:hypothetical protein
MRSDSLYIAIILGLLGTFGGVGLTAKFLAAKTQTERLESFINDDKLSLTQKAILSQIVTLPKEQSKNPADSLHHLFSKLGQEQYEKSSKLHESDPKKAALELAGSHFYSAAEELNKRSANEQVRAVLLELEIAFAALKQADEPVNLPMDQAALPVNPTAQELKVPVESQNLTLAGALLGLGTAGLSAATAWYGFKTARRKVTEPSNAA